MAASKLVVIIGILIPFAWSALLELARRLGSCSRHSTRVAGRAEQAMLILMIAPLLGAACLETVVTLVPSAGTVLPAAVRLTLAQSAVPSFHSARPSPDWIGVAASAVALLYLAGALRLFLRLVQGNFRLRRVLASSTDASAMWGEGVRLSMGHVPAFATGRANIVLPDALVRELSPQQTALVVRHEREHLRRGDPYLFQALAVVDVACWCNPIVRRQAERCRLAAELACDAAATCGDANVRRTYAEALVAALRQAAGYERFSATASVPYATQGDYHMRIREIMRPSEQRKGRRAWAPIVLGLLLAGPLMLLQADLAGAAVTRATVNSGLLLPSARLEADHLDLTTTGQVILTGRVVVEQEGFDLRADQVVLTPRSVRTATANQFGTMVAEGNVEARVSKAGMKLLGDNVTFTSDAIVDDGDTVTLRGTTVRFTTQGG